MTDQEWGGSTPTDHADEPEARPRVRRVGPIEPRVSLPDFFAGGAGRPGVNLDLPSLSGRLGIAPSIARGKAYGPTAGTWYRVVYAEPMRNAIPLVVALTREGSVRTHSLARLARLRAVELPYLTDLQFEKKNYADEAYNYTYDRVGGWLGSWGTFDFLKGALIWPLAMVAWAAGRVTNLLRDILLGPFIDQFNARLRYVIGARDSSGRWVSGVNGAIQSMHDFRGEIQSRMDDLLGIANARVPDLLSAWGIPSRGVLVTPQVKDITDTGFSFRSQGATTALWVAIGDPKS